MTGVQTCALPIYWRKTKTATCANFIHQKDAYIAMKVVDELLSLGAPIYTVHDNFITTPPFVQLVPTIYTKVFLDLGHPLRIIQTFIQQNLIIPYSEKDIHSLRYHSLDHPLPSEKLSDLLTSLRPTSQNKNTWTKNVTALMQSYHNYVETVYGLDLDSNRKWDKWKGEVERRSHNYSLHY